MVATVALVDDRDALRQRGPLPASAGSCRVEEWRPSPWIVSTWPQLVASRALNAGPPPLDRWLPSRYRSLPWRRSRTDLARTAGVPRREWWRVLLQSLAPRSPIGGGVRPERWCP